MDRYIATALIFGAQLAFLILMIIKEIKATEKLSKPKLPKNIRAYAGRYLIGECPKCERELTNCDGMRVSGISYCPCCGTKIKFPYCTPQMYGIKSISIDEYSKGAQK